MSLRRAPLPAYAPSSPSGQVYLALWQEIQARMAQRPRPEQTLSGGGVEPDDEDDMELADGADGVESPITPELARAHAEAR
jgi:hypothetical protein